MQIYLASPLFEQRELDLIDKTEKLLRKRGFQVWSPREHEARESREKNPSAWSLETFCLDRRYLDQCDCVVMLYYGNYSDSGSAWECGYAYAIHKPVIVVHLGKDSNLMVCEGCHTNLRWEELETYDFETMPCRRYEGESF